MATDLSIGFIGAGKMATALAQGFVKAGLVRGDQIVASDPVPEAGQEFEKAILGGRILKSNKDVATASNVLILAVKPHQVDEAIEDLSGNFNASKLLISIAAGITIRRLEKGLGESARLIRVMPNTPALVGASASAYSLGKGAQLGDGEMVQKLLTAVGCAYRVKESLLDAVTGLSGSGPAYVFMVIEALSDGGVAAGLPRDVATTLAAQTVMGSAQLLLETGKHPGELKDMVTSPAGTTIEGLSVLEQAGVRGAFMKAVRKATDRARALGQT